MTTFPFLRRPVLFIHYRFHLISSQMCSRWRRSALVLWSVLHSPDHKPQGECQFYHGEKADRGERLFISGEKYTAKPLYQVAQRGNQKQDADQSGYVARFVDEITKDCAIWRVVYLSK